MLAPNKGVLFYNFLNHLFIPSINDYPVQELSAPALAVAHVLAPAKHGDILRV